MLQTNTRNLIQAQLAKHHFCTINATLTGTDKSSATAALYYNQGFELRCLMPRWSEVAFQLEENPQTLVVINLQSDTPGDTSRLCWLEYRGEAELTATSEGQESSLHPVFGMHLRNHPADYFWIVRIKPQRIDLFDSQQGWKVIETLEFF